jgi:hypothetical protein
MSEVQRSADVLAKLILGSNDLFVDTDKGKILVEDLLAQAKSFDPDINAIPNSLSRWIVITLCVSLLFCVAGLSIYIVGVMLYAIEAEVAISELAIPDIPNAIVALTSGLLGALTGFLAPSPFNRR